MEILDKKELEEYRRFVETHPNGHILQSPEWGKVKNNWKWEAVVERDEKGNIIGGLSVLIRKIPGIPFTVMYSPRGPVCDLDRIDIISSLIAGIKMLARKYNACVFKVDPNVPADNLQFKGPMERMGFNLKKQRSSCDGIQKPNVFHLNILGKTEEEIMAQFSSKTRYNIRLALKHNVEVQICGKDRLDDFMCLMEQTGERDGFKIRPKDYFKRILEQLGKHARLYMAFYEGQPIAGTIAVQYGDKTWYLYGASSNSHRNTMPNYLLQWEMIKWALECKCSVYDFRGACSDQSAGNSLYGLYRFKKGFGGDYVQLIGELDMILNRPAFAAFESGVRLSRTLNDFFLNWKKKSFQLFHTKRRPS